MRTDIHAAIARACKIWPRDTKWDSDETVIENLATGTYGRLFPAEYELARYIWTGRSI